MARRHRLQIDEELRPLFGIDGLLVVTFAQGEAIFDVVDVSITFRKHMAVDDHAVSGERAYSKDASSIRSRSATRAYMSSGRITHLPRNRRSGIRGRRSHHRGLSRSINIFRLDEAKEYTESPNRQKK
ncbi:hypothetical protein D3C75_939010 [compost metagenome]